MDKLISDIFDDLLLELDIDASSKDVNILEIKIRNAVSEVVSRMNYPSYYTETDIVADLNVKKSIIRNIAMYDFCQVGSEWQTSHVESSVTMHYKDRNSLFSFLPFSSLV